MMEWKDLAPWIAIAFTLALSILVPLFTQIVNNRHKRKMLRDKHLYIEQQKKIEAYETFLSAVGGVVTANGHVEKEQLFQAGSAIHKLYAYVPDKCYSDLDQLTTLCAAFEWKEARELLQKLARMIVVELNGVETQKKKRV